MLVWIIIIIVIFHHIWKKSQAINEQNGKGRQRYNSTVYTETRSSVQMSQAQTAERQTKSEPRKVTAQDRARLEAYRAQKAAAAAIKTAPSAAGYPVQKAAPQKQADILTRAQQNVKKYEADVTLEELEQDHDHTEKAARTISREELLQKKAAHPHDAAHVSAAVEAESESLLGSIEDLMVKGYDGKLSFERDFVGEGMDMISRFTVPDTIPDGTVSD